MAKKPMKKSGGSKMVPKQKGMAGGKHKMPGGMMMSDAEMKAMMKKKGMK